jgi:hypothetical protein
VRQLCQQQRRERLLMPNRLAKFANVLALPGLNFLHQPPEVLVQKPADRTSMDLIKSGAGLELSGLLPAPGAVDSKLMVCARGHTSLSAATPKERVIRQTQNLRHAGHTSTVHPLCWQGLVDVSPNYNVLQRYATLPEEAFKRCLLKLPIKHELHLWLA